MKKLKEYLKDFQALIFPANCASCGNIMNNHNEIYCFKCYVKFPRTNYHQDKENPITRLFRGKLNIESASAYLYFQKGEKVQHLIHQLKYKGRKEIGIALGKDFGRDLIKSASFNTINTIIPIPLHADKLKNRGYNQSEYFALGLAEAMKIEINTEAIVRVKNTESQTKKKFFARFENVEEIFEVVKPEQITGKHILLVDDVITTGATIESCASQLLKVENVKLSIASIAYRD